MAQLPSFQLHDLDIVGEVNDISLMGRLRGEEVGRVITHEIENMLPGNLLVVDASRALVVDYDFCRYAFGPLFDAFVEGSRFARKYVAFCFASQGDRENFFDGLLTHIGQRNHPYGQLQGIFTHKGLYAKMLDCRKTEIEFIGSVNQEQGRVLDEVNTLGHASIRDLVDRLSISETVIVDALRFLGDKYFVVPPENASVPGQQYYAFRNFLGKAVPGA